MDVIRIGEFELHPSERTLCMAGHPVELGARAFDLLLVLAENAGRLVPKATLIERVWPRLVVDENNLPAQVAGLRRVLGPKSIRTIPGYGYRLELGVIHPGTEPRSSTPRVSTVWPVAPSGENHPRPATRSRITSLLGRDEDIQTVEAALGRTSMVTVVGAAGVGKTRLVEEVLTREIASPLIQTAFASLSPLQTIVGVPETVALALGLTLTDGRDPFEALGCALDQTTRLLVLDSVEHLAEMLVSPLTKLLSHCRGLRLLLTSQTPVGVAGETVYRLGALLVPSGDATTLDECASPAVALFAQRAAAADRNFTLNRTNAAWVAEICRRLDGNPLALELAAARVPALGVRGLLERLDDRFRLLKQVGQPPNRRHGALLTAFEWSYGLLSPEEQRVFRRLGAFRGSFSLTCGANSVTDETLDSIDATDLIGRLVDRSLAIALPTDPPRYALSETARYFAIDRLADAGEDDAARSRMAATTLEQMDLAYQEYWFLDEALWIRRYQPELDNVRAAIDWSATHDRPTAVALYGSAWPLFVEAELHAEIRRRFEQTVGLLVDRLPRGRLSRFWEAVATYDSTRQCDRARYAAELASAHAETNDYRSQYYALMQLALNSRDDHDAAQQAFATARGLEQSDWPPRLLTYGALTEAALLTAAGDTNGARDACRRTVRLALAVSDRQALAATVRIVELDVACGDAAGALQIGRPLSANLRHSGRHATHIDLLIINVTALLMAGDIAEALSTASELYTLATRVDGSRLYAALDAMSLLACEKENYDAAARIAAYADFAYEAHGMRARGPTESTIRSTVTRKLDHHLGVGWKTIAANGDRVRTEVEACALALGLQP